MEVDGYLASIFYRNKGFQPVELGSEIDLLRGLICL